MRMHFPSVLNTLQSLAAHFALPAVDQNAVDGSDVKSDTSDQYPLDKEMAPYDEVIKDDFGEPRLRYRSHYRSIFPHMY